MKRHDYDNPPIVAEMLERTKRTPGWNNRSDETLPMYLPNMWGRERCMLLIVPASRWARLRYEMRQQPCRSGGNAA